MYVANTGMCSTRLKMSDKNVWQNTEANFSHIESRQILPFCMCPLQLKNTYCPEQGYKYFVLQFPSHRLKSIYHKIEKIYAKDYQN